MAIQSLLSVGWRMLVEEGKERLAWLSPLVMHYKLSLEPKVRARLYLSRSESKERIMGLEERKSACHRHQIVPPYSPCCCLCSTTSTVTVTLFDESCGYRVMHRKLDCIFARLVVIQRCSHSHFCCPAAISH